VIYINGDSWSRNLWTERSPEDWCWAKQLSDKINQPILNQSAGCGSNSRAVDMLTRCYTQDKKFDLVLIGLTTPMRWHLPAKTESNWSIGPTVINDRVYKHDETILKWWRVNSLNTLEYTFQYYNHIWKMHEFCSTYYKCPVVFFNAWDNDMYTLHKKFINDSSYISTWCQEQLGELHFDYSFFNYVQSFEFFVRKSQDWFLEMQPWSDLLSAGDYDGPNDKDPRHPSKIGHKKIADFVLATIKSLVPNTYNKLIT
jgi:hypothetical protein|tara:strand:+ start:44 stop:811 length:768 start_codon:yes stop_codon:yes gene_type:complete